MTCDRPMATEICAACGRQIGRPELARVHAGRVFCGECDQAQLVRDVAILRQSRLPSAAPMSRPAPKRRKRRRNILFIPLESMHKCAFGSLAAVAAGVGWSWLNRPGPDMILWSFPALAAGAWSLAAILDICENRGP